MNSSPERDRIRTERRIIDFRLRPPTGPYRTFFTGTVVGSVNRILGHGVPRSYTISTDPFPRSEERALQAMLDEMNGAGVRLGIANGRHSVNRPVPVHIEDADLSELSARTDRRVLGLAGVDFDKSTEDIIKGLDMAVNELGLVGVCLEPGLAREPMYADDERLFPIYDKIDELGIPLLFMSGPLAGPDITHTDPVRFDRVARRHPTMPVILGHGCYPYVTEAIALAFKSEATGQHNVFLSPDVYMFAPGGQHYADAVNWIPSRFVYASAYSFCGIEESVRATLELPINDEALAPYLYGNAEALLARVIA